MLLAQSHDNFVFASVPLSDDQKGTMCLKQREKGGGGGGPVKDKRGSLHM